MGDRDELCGRTLGEFVLRERIGEGGFGAVYRCEQPLLGREAVIKVLHHGLRDSEVVLQRFMREAQLASRLDHPYAAHVYAFGVDKDDGLFWIAMELVQGTTLDRWLRDRGKLPVDQLVPFFERVAEVVQTAHERGIIHRDLKPSNIMVIERAGRLLPKLLDFGIAKLHHAVGAAPAKLADRTAIGDSTVVLRRAAAVVGHAATLSVSGQAPPKLPSEVLTLPPATSPPAQLSFEQPLTQADATIGSPPYMSPEQWLDALSVGPRSDLYALGIVAYEALAGRRPFSGVTLAALADLHCNAEVPPLGDGFPPALDGFFRRALAKRPNDRPASALELAAELRIAAGLGTSPADLPKLDDGVRDAWLTDGPQPLAEAIAALDGARNVHQARDAARDVFRGVLRYLLALALAARAQVRGDHDDPALLELLRALRSRELDDDERVRLLRLLVRPFEIRRGAYPLPELVDAVTRRDDRDAFDPILALHPTSDSGGGEALVRSQLVQLVGELTRLLRATAFVLDYPLVVPRDGAAERWTGLRRQRRALITTRGAKLDDLRPVVVDRDGRAAVLAWPLMQVIAPTAGAELELFVFDGRGRHGARLTSAPAGFEHHDPEIWEWLGEHVVGLPDAAGDAGADERPPYLGLASFSEADADRFVGREREVDAFSNRLRQRPLQVVVGASGAGKSSFVHAGVIPSLPAGWRAITMRPGASPLASLAARLAAAGVSTADLRPLLEASPTAAASLVAHAAGDGTIVLVVDQLEELFTLCTDAREREQLAAVLAELASSAESRTRVICTVRDDFLMDVEGLAALRTSLSPSLYLLGNPSRDDLVRTIVEPARRAGYELADADLAHDMVAAVADRPGALALLSFTASRLWELRDRRFHQLTRKAYDAMGGVGGALGRHAEATLATLASDEQRVARDAFRHLVTSDETRAVLTMNELRQRLGSPRADAVIDKLVASRLLAVSEADGDARIEIVHEALIAAWPRLQQWVREDADGVRMREQLRTAANQWSTRDRQHGLLWRDEALADLERWRRRGDVSLTEVETAFADASRTAAMRGRRLRRAALTLAFLALGTTAVVMFGLRQDAAEQGELARDQTALATKREKQIHDQLAKSFEDRGQQALLAGDTDTALVFLNEAFQMGEDTAALRFMIARAIEPLRPEVATQRGPPRQLWAISFSPDGSRVLTAGQDGTVRVWDPRDGRELLTLSGHAQGLLAAAWSPDGKQIMTGDTRGQLRSWGRDGKLQWAISASSGGIVHVAFSADGKLAASCSATDGDIGIWNASTSAKVSRWKPDSGVFDVEFDRTGQRIMTAGLSGNIAVWSLDGRRVLELDGHTAPVWFARYNPSADRIASASLDGTARIWDLDGKSRVLRGHEGRVTHVSWAPSGHEVVTSGADRTARIWDAATGDVRTILRGHAAQVNHAEFTPDGAHVVTVAADGTARVWDARSGLQTASFSHPGFLYDAAVDRAGARLATASWTGTGKIWDLHHQLRIARLSADDAAELTKTRGRRSLQVGPHGAWLWDSFERPPRKLDDKAALCGDVAANGEFAAVGDDEGAIRIFDAGGESPRIVRGHPGGVFTLAISPAGDRFATWGADHVVNLWAPDGQRLASQLVQHGAARTNSGRLSLIYSTTGARLVAFDQDGSEIALLDGRNLELIAHLPGQAYEVAFSADDRLLTGGLDGIARVWTDRGVLAKQLPQHVGAISDVAWSPAAHRVAIGGMDGTLQIVNVSGWDVVAESTAHDNFIAKMTFTPDEQLIVTGGADRSVKIWDAVNLAQVGGFHTDGLIESLSFDRDGNLFESDKIRTNIWRVTDRYRGSPPDLAGVVCKLPKAIRSGRLVDEQVCR